MGLAGLLAARRIDVHPFTPAQIKLLETFADQAVIAIENVRLFQELKESLEQQTATSEILGVIASSPTDIQPVLDTVAENAARLCDANDAVIFRVFGDNHQRVAKYGSMPAPDFPVPISRGVPGGRAIVDRQTVHIHDLELEIDTEYPAIKPIQKEIGQRTVLATPLLREGVAIGAIVIRRIDVRPFTDKQIKLLETFAAQAVIAIENVRLFKELGERNAELREALEHQTATAEVLGSSAARPRTCSRCSTPSLRAPPGFAGSMTWSVATPRGRHYGSAGTFWSHAHRPASRSVLMSHSIAGCRSSMARFHIPDVRAQS